MTDNTENKHVHKAWRFAVDGTVRYVQEINHTGKGDRYSYTWLQDKALPMTEHQCRMFCAYMKQCYDVGFWS
jgi:hypothetical protein